MPKQEINKGFGGFGPNAAPFHTHNKTDSPPVSFNDLSKRSYVMTYTLFGTQAATAGNYSTFFIVPFTAVITKIQEVHAVLGTDVGAVSLNIEKLTGTTAPGSGTTILSTAFDLKGTINTVNTGTLTNTQTTLQLAIGNRLALKLTGTPTSVANVTVSITMTY